MTDKKNWLPGQHEARVQKFYGTGAHGFHDYHQGYLNFGLWTRPDMSYVEAAQDLVQHMGELLGLNEASRLLDVGCGMGTQDIFLYRKFNPKSIIALDVTWKHVLRARIRAKREGIAKEKINFIHGTATALPFPDQSFTHLLSIEAPEHFNTREDFFREAYRVLRPGGVLTICDYSLARKPKNFFEKSMILFACSLWQVPKANIYGNEILKQKLESAGFCNIDINNVGAKTIVGYYFEHRRPKTVKDVAKVRGFWKGVIGGFLIDWAVYKTYKMGLTEYIILKAKKTNFVYPHHTF